MFAYKARSLTLCSLHHYQSLGHLGTLHLLTESSSSPSLPLHLHLAALKSHGIFLIPNFPPGTCFDICLCCQIVSFWRTRTLSALFTLISGIILTHNEHAVKPLVVSHHPVNEAPTLCRTSDLLFQMSVSTPAEGTSTHQRREPSKLPLAVASSRLWQPVSSLTHAWHHHKMSHGGSGVCALSVLGKHRLEFGLHGVSRR